VAPDVGLVSGSEAQAGHLELINTHDDPGEQEGQESESTWRVQAQE